MTINKFNIGDVVFVGDYHFTMREGSPPKAFSGKIVQITLEDGDKVEYKVQLANYGNVGFNGEELFASREDYFMHLLERYTKELEAVSKNRLTVIRWLQEEADNQ